MFRSNNNLSLGRFWRLQKRVSEKLYLPVQISGQFPRTSHLWVRRKIGILSIILTLLLIGLGPTDRAYGAVTITEFPIPAPPPGGPYGITSGPDGNLWFDDEDNIGRITPAGAITQFLLPPPTFAAAQVAYDITAGPDGNLWFTELADFRIGK